MMIVVSILVLGLLIFVHELGHFLLAKWNRVGVVEFAIGFGKPLYQRTYGETLYSLRLVPLGGYVRMVGDDPRELSGSGGGGAEQRSESSLTGADSAVDPKLLADRSRWFLTKGYLAKMSIVLAGPGFNLLFAVIVAIASFAAFGRDRPTERPQIGGVIPAYPAEKAGLRAGDVVRTINGQSIDTWVQLADTVAASGGRELVLGVERPSETAGGAPVPTEIKVVGQLDGGELAVLEGVPPGSRYKIGIIPSTEREAVDFATAVFAGTTQVWHLSVITVRGFWGMIQGAISPKHIGGPIFIFKEAAQSARRGLPDLLSFMVFLSVSLAILNLLPIPILDGGHLVFFTLEALKGSPVSLKLQERANQVGLAFLLLLMIFALGNDILRLF